MYTQGRPSLQADHADCVGPHLAEGASTEPHLCAYAAQLVWRVAVSPLRGSTSTPRRRSQNRGPHHITWRGASSWPGTALCIRHLRSSLHSN